MRRRELQKQEIDELNAQRQMAVRQVRDNGVALASAINENIQKLTDMAPGLNKNPYVQTMRVQALNLVGLLESL